MAKTISPSPQLLNYQYYTEYQPDFDVWSVHFENCNALPLKKVSRLFQKYGAIKSVSQTGSISGYCFISYFREADAKNCVLHIASDGITLRPFSPKVRLIKDKQLFGGPDTVEFVKKRPLQVINLPKMPEDCNDTNNNLSVSKTSDNLATNYEKFYEAKSVFFANPMKISKEKIREIFSKYGFIETIQQTGSPSGWCFVRFGAEEFARDCAIDIMSKGIIKLEEFKPAAALRARKQMITSRMEPGSSRSVSSDNSLNGENALETDECSSFEGQFEDLSNFDWSISRATDSKLESRADILKKLRKLSKDIPNVIQKVIMKSGKSFYVPINSKIPWKKLTTVVVKEIQVASVIVANIHEHCGVDFLAQLFEKDQPIYVSTIKGSRDGSWNYCYIYTESDSSANAAALHYDNVDVYGRNLIVVRPETVFGEN